MKHENRKCKSCRQTLPGSCLFLESVSGLEYCGRCYVQVQDKLRKERSE